MASPYYYSTAWRSLRESMPKAPCADCGAPWRNGFNLDHVTARRFGGQDTPSNLVWRCQSCHSRKTASQNGGYGNKNKGLHGCDINGLPLDPNHHWRKT